MSVRGPSPRRTPSVPRDVVDLPQPPRVLRTRGRTEYWARVEWPARWGPPREPVCRPVVQTPDETPPYPTHGDPESEGSVCNSHNPVHVGGQVRAPAALVTRGRPSTPSLSPILLFRWRHWLVSGRTTRDPRSGSGVVLAPEAGFGGLTTDGSRAGRKGPLTGGVFRWSGFRCRSDARCGRCSPLSWVGPYRGFRRAEVSRSHRGSRRVGQGAREVRGEWGSTTGLSGRLGTGV